MLSNEENFNSTAIFNEFCENNPMISIIKPSISLSKLVLISEKYKIFTDGEIENLKARIKSTKIINPEIVCERLKKCEILTDILQERINSLEKTSFDYLFLILYSQEMLQKFEMQKLYPENFNRVLSKIPFKQDKTPERGGRQFSHSLLAGTKSLQGNLAVPVRRDLKMIIIGNKNKSPNK